MKRDTIENIKMIAFLCALFLAIFLIPKVFDGRKEEAHDELTDVKMQAARLYDVIKEINNYSDKAIKTDAGDAEELKSDLYHIYDLTEKIVLEDLHFDLD